MISSTIEWHRGFQSVDFCTVLHEQGGMSVSPVATCVSASLRQWFSNLSVHHLEGLLNRLLDPTPDSGSAGLGGWRTYISNKYPGD